MSGEPARAGRSAAEMAALKRAKAKRLEEEARNWEQGAEGERRVGAILDRLPPSHVVFHDLRVPGSRANIDHLVIGPYGVFVVDSKKFSNPVTRSSEKGVNRLWTGRSQIRLEPCRWEASEVERLIGVPVRPTMCIIAPSIPEPVFEFDSVRICRTDRVLAEMTPSPPAGVQQVDVEDVSRRVSKEFATEPQVRDPSELNPHAARGVWSALSSEESGRKRPPFGRARRTSKPVREHALVKLAVSALPILALLAFLPFLPAIAGAAGTVIGDRLASSVESATAPPPATSSTTSTTVATAPPAFSVPPAVLLEPSCPNPGMGWVVSFGWPGDLPQGAAAYAIRWQLDGGPVIRHDFGGWSDPAQPQVAMRIPNGTDQLFFTDYLDDAGQILATTEQVLEIEGDC